MDDDKFMVECGTSIGVDKGMIFLIVTGSSGPIFSGGWTVLMDGCVSSVSNMEETVEGFGGAAHGKTVSTLTTFSLWMSPSFSFSKSLYSSPVE